MCQSHVVSFIVVNVDLRDFLFFVFWLGGGDKSLVFSSLQIRYVRYLNDVLLSIFMMILIVVFKGF